MQYNKGNPDNMHSYSTNTQVIITGLTNLRKGKAILPMLVLIIALEGFSRSFYPLPNTSGLLTIMLMYCILKFGIKNGIINASLAILYTIYYYALPEGLYPYRYFNIFAILCNSAALIGTLLIMGLQGSRLQSYSTRLEKSEKKLSSLFQNANDSIFLYRLNNENLPDKYIEVNDTACRRLGFTEEEFMRMTPLDINILNSQEGFMQIINRLLITGHCTIETTHRCKNSGEIPVEVSSHMIVMGNERMVLSIARDLSDKRADFIKLKESEERYRQLAEYSPYAIAVHYKGKIIYANNSAARLVKLDSPELLIGRSLQDFICVDAREYIMGRLDEVESGEAEASRLLTERIVAVDGSSVDVEITNIAFPNKGDMAVQIILRDITDRKKAEMLEEDFLEKKRLLEDVIKTDQFKTELFSNISHELRTPINVIFATLQLMELYVRDQLNCNDLKAINKYLHITKQNSYRLLRLVNNSIDLSKIDSGFFQLNLQNYDIVNLVEDIALSVAGYIEHRLIHLQFDTDIEELIIACDPDKIERIILNLLSNAVKFTQKGGSIFVNINHQRDIICISVRDTGVGIPHEKQETVFQRYKQLNESLIKNFNGSGIGLSLVKSLVELHDGQISVYSEPDQGSEFVVRLPIRMLPDNEVQHTHQNISEGRIERISIEFSDIYT